MSDHPTDTPAHDAEGRLFVLTGPGADDVARALTAALPRAASVDGAVVEAMFAGESGIAPSDTRTDLERRYLRYTAGIALADSFRFAGYDAVVAEDVSPAHLEDYLDFAEPTLVRLVRLVGGEEPVADPDIADAVTGGIEIDGTDPQAAVAQIIARADDAIVSTTGDSA